MRSSHPREMAKGAQMFQRGSVGLVIEIRWEEYCSRRLREGPSLLAELEPWEDDEVAFRAGRGDSLRREDRDNNGEPTGSRLRTDRKEPWKLRHRSIRPCVVLLPPSRYQAPAERGSSPRWGHRSCRLHLPARKCRGFCFRTGACMAHILCVA